MRLINRRTVLIGRFHPGFARDHLAFKLSFGIVRANHFMRTTPLSLWSKQAKEFDTLVGQTVFQCLGLKPTDEAHEQASVSTTIGGLGIRRTMDHAKGAFTASWFEGQVITGETWVKPPDEDCSSVYQSQQRASSATDATIMTKLKTNANPREAQRLNRLAPLTPMRGSLHAPRAWMEPTPSFPPGSTGLPLPVSWVNLCSLPLPRALFASNLWIYLGITPCAARSPATELRGTIA